MNTVYATNSLPDPVCSQSKTATIVNDLKYRHSWSRTETGSDAGTSSKSCKVKGKPFLALKLL